MKNSKNKRILAVILLGLLVLAYKVMFAPASDVAVIDESASTAQKVETILKQVESINFDTKIIENQNFKSLKSIEIPMISLPIGRKNPFSSALK
jgi:conjugal transfer/entry exclusion protein